MEDLTDAELEALIRAYATPSATLTGVEQPEPAPEIAPAPLPIPQQWQGLPDRPSQEMVARPLMPQTAQEAQDQAEANQRLETTYRLALNAGLLATPVGGVVRGAGLLARGVGNVLGANAATRAGTAVAGTALAVTGASGQAGTPPDPVQAQEARIAEAEAAQRERLATARAARERLAEFRRRFGGVTSTSPQARILELQQYLAGPDGDGAYGKDEQGKVIRPDGVWGSARGSGTQAAIDRFTQGLQQQVTAAEKAHETGTTSLRDLNAAMRGLRRDQLTRQAYDRLSWPEQAVHDWGPYIGGAAGFVTGPVLRRGMTAFFDRQWLGRTADANALLGRGGAAPPRVSRLNAYFAAGGGRPPFAIDARAPLGFRATRPQQPATELFPPGGQWGAPDWAAMGLITAGGARAGFSWADARSELADAREAASKEVSFATIERAMRAEVRMGWQNIMAMGLAGAVTGYPLAAATKVRYSYPPPNNPAAQAEVMNLNAMLRRARPRGGGGRPPPGSPIPIGGAYTPSGTTPPGATFSTPAGRRGATSDPNSPTGWVDQTGAPTEPPRRGWIRRSDASGADLAIG